ncbi:MAG: T9SS type A sorting domain-containing protein [Ginsengibacter sp.]
MNISSLNYSRFKDNAANNYITITNNQLYDKYVGGVWQNPYQSEQVFLLSPPVNFYQGKSLQVLLPSNLWFTNNAGGITSLQIDAGDGVGYRTLTQGVPITVNYADTGRKEWTYKLTISGGAILYSHSQIVINTDYSGSNFLDRPESPTGEVFPPSPFTATKQYLGIAGQGYATIQYANADHILRKPLIVAEGYDAGKILTPENKFGISSLKNFLDDATDDGSNLTNLLSGSMQQYDIVYVDWKNGVDYLQRNAYLLETIIKWVNDNKQPLNGVMQPTVVLGQSMGGVIARYALKDMENTGLNHQTRLYISDDAPHQGANVPEGYQHLARHARSLYIRTGVTALTYEIIQLIRGGVSPFLALSLADQPASKQMLINFVNGSNAIDNSVHNAWETELKNLGYPAGFTGTPFRFVAVSNGSECANPQAFGAGANLLTFTGKGNTRFLSDIAGTSIFPVAGILLGQPALLLGIFPGRNDFSFDFAVNAQADGASNQVYRGKITYKKTIFYLIPVTVNITNRSYNSSASTLPYDYFPGGYYPVPINLSSTTYKDMFIKYSITASNQPTFNFVPTVSALDIGSNNVTLTKSDYLTRYIGAIPPSAPKNTPFQNFITAFNNDRVNEQHISIERRNGDWIAAELNSLTPSANCSSSCDLTTISGDASICNTSNSYSIPNLLPGSTVYWSAMPDLVNFSCNPCAQPTLTKKGNGQMTLTATINNACVSSIIVNKQNITVGLPTIYGAYTDLNGQHPIQYWTGQPSSYNNVCNAYTAQTNMTVMGATSGVSWSKVSSVPSSISWSQVNNDVSFYFWQIGQTGVFEIDAANACGTTSNTFGFKSIDCGGGGGGCLQFTIAPNPAKGTLKVIVPDIPAPCDGAQQKQTTKSVITQVKIFDNMGTLKKMQNENKVSQASVNLSGLNSGVYWVEIYNGTYKERQQVIIEK